MRDAAEKIRIERQNHVRLFQLVLRVGVVPNAAFDAARAESRFTGSHWTSFACGYVRCTCFHCAASVGDVIVSLRK